MDFGLSNQVINPYAGTVRVGRIVDINPYNNNYRVDITGAPECVQCRDLSNSASYTPGSSSSKCFSVGTRVLVFLPPEWPHTDGFIIGSIPHPWPYGEDIVFPTVQYYNWPPYIPYRQSYTEYAQGTEFYTMPGQDGVSFPTGARYSIEPFRAFIGVSEKAGVEANLIDHYLRLCGYNYDVYSSGSVEKRRVEYGEYDEVYMSTPYIWEAKSGAFQRQFANVQIGGRIYTPAWSTGYPPVLPRYVRFGGYLGELERTIVQVPNLYASFSPDETNASVGLTHVDNGVRVFDRVIGIDGSYSLRSAKEIEIAKVSLMPPILLFKEETEYEYDPDDPSASGDFYPAGIKFTDYGSCSPFYTVPGTKAQCDIRHYFSVQKLAIDGEAAEELTGDETADLGLAIAGLLAEAEYTNRYIERLQTITNHPAWSIPTSPAFALEETDIGGWLMIDHRTWTRYQEATSFIRLLEDGSIVLQAGSGDTASKIVLHPEGGVEIVAPNIMATSTDASGAIMLGAESVHITATGKAQIGAGDDAEIWATNSLIAENFISGKLSAERTTDVTDITWTLLSNDGTGWTEEGSGFTDYTDGAYAIDVSAIDMEDKLFKVRLSWETEDIGGSPLEEYVESNVFTLGGGSGGSGDSRRVSLNGGNAADFIVVPTTEVIIGVNLTFDPLDEAVINFSTGCLMVEDV